MGNYGKPKKIVGRNFRANLLLYSCIILGCYALFNVNKFFWNFLKMFNIWKLSNLLF